MRKIEELIDKAFLLEACDNLFSSTLGKKIENEIMDNISLYSMNEHIKKGVILGFSGGADSVLLLIFLRNLQKKLDFSLKAVHINHLIRGDEANDDEAFSKEFAEALGIKFISKRIDVPAIAKTKKIGIEEAARVARYEFFDEVLSESENFETVATAHNSTDNLETFIFNFMRGSGLRGLSGIAPVRNNIIRPLLSVSKSDILKLLLEAKIPFVTDKTNFSCDYSRNYIRHEILPKLQRLSSSPEEMATKAIRNLRADADYIDSVAESFYVSNSHNERISADELRKIHSSVFAGVLKRMTAKITDASPEKVHIDNIYGLLQKKKNFEVDIPGDVTFFCKSNLCYVNKRAEKVDISDKEFELKEGFNEIPELDIAIGISSKRSEIFSSNVYKISIQANVSSAIICGRLYVRTKKDGDSYYYGGMTRKLKKLFLDKRIAEEDRKKLPVICDEKGIVWVKGFGVRDDSPVIKTDKWITIYEKSK